MLDQIRATPEAPIELAWPTDPPARRVADLVQANLADNSPLAEFAAGSGASERTIERLFLRATRRTFGRWRQQARLLHALRRLALGESVTSAGLATGFQSTSAFIVVFRRAMGRTPGDYFREVLAASDREVPNRRPTTHQAFTR